MPGNCQLRQGWVGLVDEVCMGRGAQRLARRAKWPLSLTTKLPLPTHQINH